MSREEFIEKLKMDGFSEKQIKKHLEIADELRGEKEDESFDYEPFIPMYIIFD